MAYRITATGIETDTATEAAEIHTLLKGDVYFNPPFETPAWAIAAIKKTLKAKNRRKGRGGVAKNWAAAKVLAAAKKKTVTLDDVAKVVKRRKRAAKK